MEKTKAKKYNNIKLALSLSGMAIDLAFWLVLILSGLNIILSRFAQGFTDHLSIHFYIFAGILGIVSLVIKMPLSFYGGRNRESSGLFTSVTPGQNRPF